MGFRGVKGMRINKKALKHEAMGLLHDKHWRHFLDLSRACQAYEKDEKIRYLDHHKEIDELKKKMIVEKEKILWIESVLGIRIRRRSSHKSLKESKA